MWDAQRWMTAPRGAVAIGDDRLQYVFVVVMIRQVDKVPVEVAPGEDLKGATESSLADCQISVG